MAVGKGRRGRGEGGGGDSPWRRSTPNGRADTKSREGSSVAVGGKNIYRELSAVKLTAKPRRDSQHTGRLRPDVAGSERPSNSRNKWDYTPTPVIYF